mmetsp:Transcript_5996/g.13911  ORF Transcript_5996/g.13911 Transcript_5996/m.13911 type:complete len:298 (-) Transcript_5996:255-1148(-)
MDAVLLQRFYPEEYHRRFLKDGLRPDGRSLTQRRATKLQREALSSTFGSSSLRIGESSAVAGVIAEVTEASPDLDPESQRRISTSVELLPLSSQVFRDKHVAAGISTFLASVLNDILNSPHVLDPSQLIIREGELFWTLKVHVTFLNFDGNAFDLCVLSALAALEDTSLPSLGQESVAMSSSSAPHYVTLPPDVDVTKLKGLSPEGVIFQGIHLALKSRPLPVTFAQLPGDVWALDPNAAEEALGASVSLCLVGGKWLVYHRGGAATAEHFLSELMPTARAAMPDLEQLLTNAQRGD